MQYVVGRADGSMEVLKRRVPLPLKELQKLVGGYVEAVSILGGRLRMKAMVNEDGRLLGLPVNALFPGLLGNAVLGKVEDGEFVGFSAPEVAVLKRTWPKLAAA